MLNIWQINNFISKNIINVLNLKNVLVFYLFLQGCFCSNVNSPAPIYETSRIKLKPTISNYDYTYIVREGDTLYKISQDNNINLEYLKKLNNISDRNQIYVGQTLLLNNIKNKKNLDKNKLLNRKDVKKINKNEIFSKKPSITKTSSDETTSIINNNENINTNWVWPSNGNVISHFGSGQKGIDITSTIGSPILAASDGKVLYCGNGVRGLGNLIILSHVNNFITAYAHNDKIFVKQSQYVKKGEKIAEMGSTDSSFPKVHFEIRSKGTPVDPMNYLPKK